MCQGRIGGISPSLLSPNRGPYRVAPGAGSGVPGAGAGSGCYRKGDTVSGYIRDILGIFRGYRGDLQGISRGYIGVNTFIEGIYMGISKGYIRCTFTVTPLR